MRDGLTVGAGFKPALTQAPLQGGFETRPYATSGAPKKTVDMPTVERYNDRQVTFRMTRNFGSGTMRRTGLLVCCLAVLGASVWAEDVQVTNLRRHDDVVAGTVMLPAGGYWHVRQPDAQAGANRVFLIPSKEVAKHLQGERMRQAQRPGQRPDGPAALPWTVTTLARGVQGKSLALRFHDDRSDAVRDCRLSLVKGAKGDDELVKVWANARVAHWRELAGSGDAPVLSTWLAIQNGTPIRDRNADRRNRRGRSTSALAVLGGRAAVRETLQMQLLQTEARDKPETRDIPIGNVEGVTVKSHPFEKMLAGKPGGRLPLAELVPDDRFFIHFAKPAQLVDMLDKSAGVLARLGGVATSGSIQYDLLPRYLNRLGLTEPAVRAFLKGGAVSELAISTPDLFFIEGTDVTVVARVPALKLAIPLLARLGVPGLRDGETATVRTPSGRDCWWAPRGDLLVISTNKGELDSVLALADADGKGSLGRSAEFRYMLTQQAPGKDTVGYAYLSDSFIRRMVSPAVKIGQLRRMRARGQLEALGASALLYKADRRPGEPTLHNMESLGYLPPHVQESYLYTMTRAAERYEADGHKRPQTKAELIAQLLKLGYMKEHPEDCEIELTGDLLPTSATWGTLSDMDTLLDNPVTHVTKSEAQAYEGYLESYTRFWRQFFDPIAMRLDMPGEHQAELTVFILPLLDNTIYDGVRQALASRETGKPMRAPRMTPEPTLMLSVNLKPEVWAQAAEGFDDAFGRYTRIDSTLLDHLGPTVHVAFMDADPVVALGSGDALGAFGMLQGGGRSEMLAVPVILAGVTRPCKLLVELDDADAVLRILRRTPSSTHRERGGFLGTTIEFRKVAGRDAWVYTISIEGLIKLRYGIEVQDSYLVISNLPWSGRSAVKGSDVLALRSAGLRLFPGAIEKELSALHTAAMDNRRRAALRGASYLHPLMEAGAKDLNAAAKRHQALFGFRPVHPSGGTWVWQDGEIQSDMFGTITRQSQPEYTPGDRQFGLLGGLDKFHVTMQLEDTGLRTKMRWTWLPVKEVP